jgi:2-dehydro-3-deoxygalactonokinase
MIGVDWGISELRAYQIDASGTALDVRTAPKGIMAVTDGDFASVLEGLISDWLDRETEPVLMCGMIGSRQGWLEAPYVACPATAEQVAGKLAEVTWGKGRRAFICPGLTSVDADGVPDVMRGEEVQVFGALALQGEQTMTICHPGTHSKHISVDRGSVTGFTTFMTGELFAVLKKHSILGRTMEEGPTDWPSFYEGVRRASQPGGLLHHIFGARTRVLMGGLKAASEADYLSGILIGHEFAAAPTDEPIMVMGAAGLVDRYIRALRHMERMAQAIAGDTAIVRGLRLINDLVKR